jgi:hypothetical protein
MTMTIHHDGHRSPEEIAELFRLAGRETEAIRQLSCSVPGLLEVHAAQDCPKSLTPAEVRAALGSRPLALRGMTI